MSKSILDSLRLEVSSQIAVCSFHQLGRLQKSLATQPSRPSSSRQRITRGLWLIENHRSPSTLYRLKVASSTYLPRLHRYHYTLAHRGGVGTESAATGMHQCRAELTIQEGAMAELSQHSAKAWRSTPRTAPSWTRLARSSMEQVLAD
jgi:hypothetical protein